MNLSRRSEFVIRFVYVCLVLLSYLTDSCAGCGPGRGNNRRRNFKKLRPLVYKQHVPNVSEYTLGASGLPEGRITRDDKEFKNLVPNYNPDIIFRDDEGTGADRLMTQRCKERLNTLAISVMNQWPGVKLRVIEGWDEEGVHAQDSLHYEGRAAAITTSDRDTSKYGILARLAVEAGFDWVFYESRSHVYVSVKSESSQAAKSLGCFTGDSIVVTETGAKSMSELEVGEKVLSLSDDGRLTFSEILLFMHRDPKAETDYIRIRTESGAHITMTASHLILRSKSRAITDLEIEEIYAVDVEIGQQLLVRKYKNDDRTLSPSYYSLDRVKSIEKVIGYGVYAPLTITGTILVDDVLASCYAVISSHRVAHLAFAPVRLLKKIRDNLPTLLNAITIVNPSSSFLQESSSWSSSWSSTDTSSTIRNSPLPITFNAIYFNVSINNNNNNNINYNNYNNNVSLCSESDVLDDHSNKNYPRHSHINSKNDRNCVIFNNNRRFIYDNDIRVKNVDNTYRNDAYNRKLYDDNRDNISNSHSNRIENHDKVPDNVVKEHPIGVHWYCQLLEFISQFVIPHSWMMFQ